MGLTYRVGSEMHRLIVEPLSHEVVDHIDGDGLNNQRANLRCADLALTHPR